MSDKNLAYETCYEQFKNMFKQVVDKHVPIKSKLILDTHAPFMNKQSNYVEKSNQQKQNQGVMGSVYNKCVAIKPKSIRTYIFSSNEREWPQHEEGFDLL